jgi:GMP synthase-like glutamine amidotransferase
VVGVASQDLARKRGAIGLIMTEHPSYLGSAQQAEVARLANKVAEFSGCGVQVTHYLDDWAHGEVGALILTGSHAPWSLHRQSDLAALRRRVRCFDGPVFGICAGMQLLAKFEGAVFQKGRQAEHGFTKVRLDTTYSLFRDMPKEVEVFQQHTDEVTSIPASVNVVASNDACAVQALTISGRPWWGTQFHPELADEHHPAGFRILELAVQRLLSHVGKLRTSQGGKR